MKMTVKQCRLNWARIDNTGFISLSCDFNLSRKQNSDTCVSAPRGFSGFYLSAQKKPDRRKKSILFIITGNPSSEERRREERGHF